MAGTADTDTIDRLDRVAALGLQLHGSCQAHAAFTLDSLREHVGEVRELMRAGDPHWQAETMDMLIHCLLLLKAAGVSEEDVKSIRERRLRRFEEKITAALAADFKKRVAHYTGGGGDNGKKDFGGG